MTLFDEVMPRVATIQEIKRKFCPKCHKQMYLARWFSMWTCTRCDIAVPFSKNEIELVNKFERHYRLSETGRKEK